MSGSRSRQADRGARSLVVLGASGNSFDVLDVVSAINARAAEPAWRVTGFLDDALPAGSAQFGIPILGNLADAARLSAPGGPLVDAQFVSAIGSDKNHASRDGIVAVTGLPAHRFATLIHPSAGVSAWARVGRGCVIAFGASVGGGASVGDHAWIGPCGVVGHDSVLDPFALMAPRSTVSGFVHLGACCYVGSNAAVRQHVKVGERALVGLGSVVLRDVPAGAVVAGNPARELRPLRHHGAGTTKAAS